jgi:hypothetical protein
LCKGRLTLDEDKFQIRKWIDKHLVERADAVIGGGYSDSYYKVAEMVVYLVKCLVHLVKMVQEIRRLSLIESCIQGKVNSNVKCTH